MAFDTKYHRKRKPSPGQYVKAYQDGGPVSNTRSRTRNMGDLTAAQINPGKLSSDEILDRAKKHAVNSLDAKGGDKESEQKKAHMLAKASGTQRSKEFTRSLGRTPFDEED